MRRTIAGLLVWIAVAGAGAACRGKQEAAKATPAPAADTAADEAARRDHEIGITNLRVSSVGTDQFELVVDVHDPKGDLTPSDRAVAKYQVVCPGGSAHAVLSEPTRLETVGEGRLLARHRVDIREVKKGSEPCQIRLAIGHRYDFLSNELEGSLKAR